jgi:CDGSH-type Zn-finger protein
MQRLPHVFVDVRKHSSAHTPQSVRPNPADRGHPAGKVVGDDETRGISMGACGCGYSTDEQKQCNGTHRVVQALKADIAQALAEQGHPEAAELVKQYKKQS